MYWMPIVCPELCWDARTEWRHTASRTTGGLWPTWLTAGETAADEVTSHMQKYELGASGEYRQELRAVGLCEVPLRRGC